MTKWMRKGVGWRLGLVLGIMAFFVAGGAWAVMFFWADMNGNQRVTDRSETLPVQYREIISYSKDHYVAPSGVGYDRDAAGNFYFFDHSSPALKASERPKPAPAKPASGPSGLGTPVTPEQLADLKKRYQEWGGEPVPEVTPAKVKGIMTPDTFALDNGQKSGFIGIEFPSELAGNQKFAGEVMAYEKKLMMGQTVHLLFGPARQDGQGRLLTFVFIGTDMFVNADLVMNGYARVKTVPPNVEYKDLFLRLQGFAQQQKLGMWALPEMKASAVPAATVPPAAAKP